MKILKTTLKKLVKFASIASVFIIGLHFILLQWNFNSFFPQIQSYLDSNYSLNVKLLGNIQLKILPLPKIIITDIEFSKKHDKCIILAPETQVTINFSGLFRNRGILDLHSISIYNPKIKLFNDVLAHFQTLKEVFLNQVQNKWSSKISVINGTLQIIDDETEVIIKEMKNLNLSYNNSYSKDLKIDTSFIEDGDSYSFFLSAANLDKKLKPTSLIVSLKYNLLHLHASLYRDAKSEALLGKTRIHFHDEQFYDDHHEIDDTTKIEKIFYQQNFKYMEADTELNQEFLKIHNFTASSTDIKNVRGNASYYINDKRLNINLSIDDLNLDAILSKLYSERKESSLKATEVLNFLTTKRNLTFSKFITTSANLHINNLVYKQDNISNFVSNFSFWPSQRSNERKILINDFSMTLPGDSKFRICGVILNDKIPIFRGQVLFASTQPKNLLLWYYKKPPPSHLENAPIIVNSEVILMPYVLQLHDIQSAFKNTHMLADILTLNYPDASDLQVYTEIIANKMNLDKFNLDNKINDLVYTLYSSDFDNSGQEFTKKTNNLGFIRNQRGFKNFTIEVKELVIENETFYDVNVNIDIDRHYLKLDHLNANSKLASYTGEVQFDLSSVKPKLDIDLVFSKLDGKLFYVMFPSQESLKMRYQEQLSSQKGEDNKSTISDINFYGINNFDGKFKFVIDKFYTGGTNLNNVKLSGNVVDGGIAIDNASAQGFNGDIKATGNIFTLRPIFGLKFGIGLNNVNPSLLLNYLISSNNNTGYMSTSGVLSTKGMNKKDFVKNLDGNFQIQAKSIRYNGFGLLELVELPQLEMNYNDKLKRLDYYKKYGETKFDDVAGNLVIRNGTAKMLNMKLTNERTSGLLNLAYSLVNNSLSGNSKFSFIPKKGEKPILISVHSSGNISTPQIKIDTDDLKKYLKKS